MIPNYLHDKLQLYLLVRLYFQTTNIILRMRAQFIQDQKIICLCRLTTVQNFSELRSHGLDVEGRVLATPSNTSRGCCFFNEKEVFSHNKVRLNGGQEVQKYCKCEWRSERLLTDVLQVAPERSPVSSLTSCSVQVLHRLHSTEMIKHRSTLVINSGFYLLESLEWGTSRTITADFTSFLSALDNQRVVFGFF